MGAAEFAARMQRSNPCGLPPLVYGRVGGDAAAAGSSAAAGMAPEHAYFQAELPPGLLADCDLSAPPFALPAADGGAARPLRPVQAARVWAGLQGSVSPTHYDLAHSFLAQIRGR
jgi:hypothetical protein